MNLNWRAINRLVVADPLSMITSVSWSDDDAQLQRLLALTQQRDWCMNRLSHLSLNGRMDEARAVTAEHLELLETLEPKRSLWVRIEADES